MIRYLLVLALTAGCLGPVAEADDAGVDDAGASAVTLHTVFSCKFGDCCRDNSGCHTQAQACLACGTDFYTPQGCISDSECAAGKSCQVAPPGNSCTEGDTDRHCASACQADADCASPSTCQGGFCWFIACRSDADCSVDSACVLGGCRQALASCVSF